MSSHTKKLAILFADICGSTALYEQHGDLKARHLISRCLFLLRGTLNKHSGMLIKTIGDEILCTFPSAETALLAACDMQLAVQADNKSSEHPLYVRIGFNYGDTICEENDIFGDAVNVASRVAGITRASQVMTTQAVLSALPPEQHGKLRQILRADIKGKQEQLEIYQVMWEPEDFSSTRIGLSAYRKPQSQINQLTLKYRDKNYSLDEINSKLSLGREDNCQLVIKNDFVSRQHATLTCRHGKFVLADHSSNGTFIRTQSGHISRINREEVTLHGSGTISLGQPFNENINDLVEFTATAETTA